jgi:hypothetical protein
VADRFCLMWWFSGGLLRTRRLSLTLGTRQGPAALGRYFLKGYEKPNHFE